MESADDPLSNTITSLALLHQIQQQLFSHTHFLLLYVAHLFSLPVTKLLLYQISTHLAPAQIWSLVLSGPFLVLFLFLILLRLLKKLLHIFFPFVWTKLLDKPQESTFLEVTFPNDTNKSAYATQQLYNLLHRLAQPKSYLALYIKRKITFSLEIVSSKEQGIRYLMVVPTDTKEIIKRNLRSYLPGVEVAEVNDYLPSHTGFTQRQKPTKAYCKNVTIEELKFSDHFLKPLASQKVLTQNDPASYLTGNMTNLLDGEIVAYQLVITPVVPKMQKEVGRNIKDITQKIDNGESIERSLTRNFWLQLVEIGIIAQLWRLLKIECLLLSIFCKGVVALCSAIMTSSGTTGTLGYGSSMPYAFPQLHESFEGERELKAVIKEKLSQPLFEVAARLVIVSDEKQERDQRMLGLVSTFVQMKSSYQSLVTKGSFFPKQATVKFRMQKFIQRRLSPGSPYNQNPIASSSEITDLFHFPYLDTTKTEDMEKVISPQLPVPLLVKNSENVDVVIGENTYGNKTHLIGLSEDERSRHMYMIGQTGSGKSTVIFHSAKDDIQKGRGVCVIDPHGDLAEDLLNVIPDSRMNDVMYFDPLDIENPIRINLLELTPGLTETEARLEKEIVCENVISIFRRIFSESENQDAHRIEHIFRHAIYTAFYVPDATLFTVYSILTNQKFLKEVLKKVDNQYLLDFWNEEFSLAGEYQIYKAISGVTAKISRFLLSEITRPIFNAPHSSVNFDQLLDQKKIILCNLSQGKLGEDTSRLIGTTIIAKIHLTMLKRARMKSSLRMPFYFYIDEFQKFATPYFTNLLTEGRKFGLRVIMAEQSTTQQKDARVTQIILATVGTKICFNTASPVDEDLLLPIFRPHIAQGALLNLPRYHFYIKLGSVDPQEPFSGTTFPVDYEVDNRKVERIIEASRTMYATKALPEERVPLPTITTRQKETKGEKNDDTKEIDAIMEKVPDVIKKNKKSKETK